MPTPEQQRLLQEAYQRGGLDEMVRVARTFEAQLTTTRLRQRQISEGRVATPTLAPGTLQFSSEGGFGKVPSPPPPPTRMTIRPYGTEEDFPETKRKAQEMIGEGKGVEVQDIDLSRWWATIPSVSEVTTSMKEDIGSGKAYAWSAEDVYNIVSTSLLVGTLAYKGIQLARGAHGTVLKGAAEIEKAYSGDDFLESQRLTRLTTQDVRISRSEAKWLQEMQRYVTPKHVEFAGQEKFLLSGGDDIIFQQKYVSALRGAKPFVSALKAKEPFVFSYTYISEPQVWSGVTKYSLRHFTTAQFFGTVDPQIYLRYIKTVPVAVAQKWYPQMGGVAIQQLERLSFPKGIGVVTKLVSVSIPKLGTRLILPPIIRPFSTQSPKAPISGSPIIESFTHFEEKSRRGETIDYSHIESIEHGEKISPIPIIDPIMSTTQGPSPISISFSVPSFPRERKTWPSPFHIPIRRGGEAGGGGRRSAFGAWWFKRHPFPTAREVLFGTKARRRRKHRK